MNLLDLCHDHIPLDVLEQLQKALSRKSGGEDKTSRGVQGGKGRGTEEDHLVAAAGLEAAEMMEAEIRMADAEARSEARLAQVEERVAKARKDAHAQASSEFESRLANKVAAARAEASAQASAEMTSRLPELVAAAQKEVATSFPHEAQPTSSLPYR